MHGPLPVPTEVDRPFWEAGRDGVLCMQRCRPCGHLFFPPGRRCVACGSPDLRWTALSGRGTIWSWIVMHKRYFAEGPPPYVVVRVKLEEGPCLLTNLVDMNGREPVIGAALRVVFEPAGELYLPQFTFAD